MRQIVSYIDYAPPPKMLTVRIRNTRKHLTKRRMLCSAWHIALDTDDSVNTTSASVLLIW